MKFQWDPNKAAVKPRKIQEMASEYRFAKKMKNGPIIVLLDDDVAKVFKTAKQVNSALRALISAMPKAQGIEK